MGDYGLCGWKNDLQLSCFPGGQLGLWVGISAVTVCEFLDLVAQLITYVCAAEKRKVDRPGQKTSEMECSREGNRRGHSDVVMKFDKL